MSFYLFLAAAALSLFGAAFHGILGRRIYLGAIRAADLPPRTVSLSAVSWDMFTVWLVVGGLTLLCVAFNDEAIWMAYPIMMMNMVGAAVFFLLMLLGHKELVRLPGAYLLAATGGLIYLAL